MAHGGLRREIAILYRSNAQSRVFEEAFLSARMPYRVYGGLRFFERAEIKDALAYLRLLSNRRDDASFERVVNLPTRGVGAKSLDVLREYAKGAGTSLWEAAARLHRRRQPRRARRRRHPRLHGAHRAAGRARSRALALHEQVDQVLHGSGLIEHYKRDKADRGEARVENLDELVSAARGFTPEAVRPAAAGGVSGARGARVRRGPGGRVGGLRADDDAALGQGPGVPGGVPRRHGGGPVPASALHSPTSTASRRSGACVMSA